MISGPDDWHKFLFDNCPDNELLISYKLLESEVSKKIKAVKIPAVRQVMLYSHLKKISIDKLNGSFYVQAVAEYLLAELEFEKLDLLLGKFKSINSSALIVYREFKEIIEKNTVEEAFLAIKNRGPEPHNCFLNLIVQKAKKENTLDSLLEIAVSENSLWDAHFCLKHGAHSSSPVRLLAIAVSFANIGMISLLTTSFGNKLNPVEKKYFTIGWMQNAYSSLPQKTDINCGIGIKKTYLEAARRNGITVSC